ncbi:uncharacterized protein EDB91DRAFT_649018 [Suillus paluster]|uniref:uncharacterized protein n=1 Tax=Suillus paluster TaxID=48578 RepID=UPI001B875DE6|nr:uncharacterized protein EDB91DRAFT_649018 [Suillus paluster]KAG1733001.1 hypothetical protein EDB91DRAFT_649018 [Suillus paluster]
MDKRSRIYSDRPYVATRKSCVLLIFLPSNHSEHLSRRLFHQTFRPDSAVKFRPVQMTRAREMIVNLIDDPRHCHAHFATFSCSVVMSVVYDYQPKARDDPLVRTAENAVALGFLR